MENSEIIYKYRSWKDINHKNCLLKNQLFFTSPRELNDPYDFKIFSDFSLLNTDYKRLQYLDLELKSYSREKVERIKDIESFVKTRLSYMRLNPEQFQAEQDLQEAFRLGMRYGILCFSLKWNNILMWTHYADNSKGYCIGFNREKIETAKIGLPGLVKYQDDFPSIDPLDINYMERINMQMQYKANAWSYEEEYRLSIFRDEPLWLQERLYIFPDEFIEEIIVGLNISEQHEDEILKIAKIRNIPAFKIVRKHNSFNFVKKPVKYEYFV